MVRDEQAHKKLMLNLLSWFALAASPYVLKGGTALMLEYGLDRFSEDIDLDQSDGALDFFDIMNMSGVTYREAKNTPTVKRAIVHYGDNSTLKVEVSSRDSTLSETSYHKSQHGFYVYNIARMFTLKAGAYQGRDRIRDAYDLCFLIINYRAEVSSDVLDVVRDALKHKGFEHLDYLLYNQKDDLVNADKLYDMYLESWDVLGLIH